MIINIKLYGILRDRYAKGTRGKLTLDLPADSTIQNVRDEIGISGSVLCVLNGRNERDFDKSLSEGDEIAFLHPVGGGVV